MSGERLERQIQEVLSSGSGDRRSVIVQMTNPAEERRDLVQAGSAALRHRALALTARDCLPVQREEAPQQVRVIPRPKLEARQDSVTGSLSAHVTSRGLPSSSEQSKALAMEQLSPLLENARVRSSLERAGEQVGQDLTDLLWAAGAVRVDLSVEDLRRLPEEVEGIDGVYVNRTLRVPPVTRVQNFPPEVLENRASAWGVERIGALASWGAYQVRGQGSRVAVLDTGVDDSHPDLQGKVEEFAEFDAQGRQVPGARAHDDDQHGTHVCGTIAGGQSSGQWIGVAPEARLSVGKVLGASGGTDAQVLAGMTWAVERQADVLSMSLGGLVLGPETPPIYTSALITCLQHGIPVVAAIGNEGSQTTGLPGNDLFALSVGATDYLDRPAGFSGGRTQIIQESDFIDPKFLPLPYSKPELSAPGVAVLSCVPGDSWEAFNGTSMATPHVSGAVALLLSGSRLRENVPVQDRAFVLQDLLIGSVDELGEAGQDHRYGFGRINVLKAIGFARERGF